MNLELDGRTAVVTGGAGAIGQAIAAAFCREGASVSIWDAPEAVEPAVAGLTEAAAGRLIGLGVDVADRGSVEQALQATRARLGAIDCLVHAAAIGSGAYGFPFLNVDPADWRRVLDVNVMGMVHVAHAVAPSMIEQNRGAMVFLASVAGQIGSQTDPPYSASKAANINFAQCLARDLAPHGVRVNALCPGMIRSALNRAVWRAWSDRQPESARIEYEDWADEKIRRLVPLGRWQQPDDVADMAVFLCSARAAHVTGQTINVDGGYVMHW